MDKLVIGLILVGLVVGAIVIISGDMTLSNVFLWAFSYHG